MIFKSPYPPLPPVPDRNVHEFMFSSPALTDPQDKLILIDPLNGKNWRRNEFKERVYDCATALVTPVSEGGLGFSPEGEMVGIMSTNCLVSAQNYFSDHLWPVRYCGPERCAGSCGGRVQPCSLLDTFWSVHEARDGYRQQGLPS